MKKAFSILELSVIITIIAIGISVYLGSITESQIVLDAQKLIVTKERMARITEAIADFKYLYNRIPCPGALTLPYNPANPANVFYNVFSATSTDPTLYYLTQDQEMLKVDESGNHCYGRYGGVPTKSLMLDSSYQFDGWGRRFTYIVSKAVCSDVSCDYDKWGEGGLVIAKNGGNASNAMMDNASFILFSHGISGCNAYLKSGSKNTATCKQDSYKSIRDNITATSSYITKPTSGYTLLNPMSETDSTKIFIDSTPYYSGDEEMLFLATYRNKTQIESVYTYATTSENSAIMPESVCENNSANLALINSSNTSGISSIINSSNNIRLTTPNNTGDKAVIDIMWNLQELCYSYFGDTAFTKTCPNNAVVDSNTGLCYCKNAVWDGSACQ